MQGAWEPWGQKMGRCGDKGVGVRVKEGGCPAQLPLVGPLLPPDRFNWADPHLVSDRI